MIHASRTGRGRPGPVVVVATFVLVSWGLAAQAPANREAAASQIAAHAAEGRLDQALSVYDGYVEARRAPDIDLLAPIARAELERAGAQAEPGLAEAALERLAAAGDRTAAQRLEQHSADAARTPDSLESLAVLARLGRKDALQRLERGLGADSIQDKLQAVQAIRKEKVGALAPQVAALLSDPNPGVRTTAAAAVGDLDYKEAAPRLREMFASDVPVVKAAAAGALARLGDTTGESHLTAMLKSEVPDVRLKAAAALQQAGRRDWVEPVRALRNDRDELARVRAAELLACCDVPTARAILIEALNSPMAPLRAEAARVLEAAALADPRLARRMLGDPFPPVRLHGAGAALRLARAARDARREGR